MSRNFSASLPPMSMAQCKKDVTPLLTHWSYVFLALSHRCVTDGFSTKKGQHYGALVFYLLDQAVEQSVREPVILNTIPIICRSLMSVYLYDIGVWRARIIGIWNAPQLQQWFQLDRPKDRRCKCKSAMIFYFILDKLYKWLWWL